MDRVLPSSGGREEFEISLEFAISYYPNFTIESITTMDDFVRFKKDAIERKIAGKRQNLEQKMTTMEPVFMQVYLDSSFTSLQNATTQPYVLIKNPQKMNSLDVTKNTLHGDTSFIHGILPLDSRLCIQLFSTTLADNGSRCLEEAGSGFVLLKDLLSGWEQQQQQQQQGKSIPIKVGLAITSIDRYIKKGYLEIILDMCKIGSNITWQKEPNPFQNLSQNKPHIDKMLDFYTNNYYREIKSLKITRKGMETISCASSPSDATYLEGARFLPTAGFLYFPAPSFFNEVFWMNILNLLSQREGYTDVMSFCDNFLTKCDTPLRASWLFKLILLYPQSFEYISDNMWDSSAQRKICVELFSEALLTRSGDCEDMAKAIMKVFLAFVENPPVTIVVGKEKIYTTFKEMHRIAVRYIDIFHFFAVTAVNPNKTTSISKKDHHHQDNQKLTAHAAVIFWPYDYFRECIGRYSSKHPLSQLELYKNRILKMEEKFPQLPSPTTNGFPAELPSPLMIVDEQLPMMLGEGTGMVSPWLKENDSIAKTRKYFYKFPMFSISKKPLYSSEKQETFYKMVASGISNRFINSHQIATFYVSSPLPTAAKLPINHPYKELQVTSGNIPNFSRGVSFALLMQKHESVFLIPSGFNVDNKRKRAHEEVKDYEGTKVARLSTNSSGIDDGNIVPNGKAAMNIIPAAVRKAMDVLKDTKAFCLPFFDELAGEFSPQLIDLMDSVLKQSAPIPPLIAADTEKETNPNVSMLLFKSTLTEKQVIRILDDLSIQMNHPITTLSRPSSFGRTGAICPHGYVKLRVYFHPDQILDLNASTFRSMIREHFSEDAHIIKGFEYDIERLQIDHFNVWVEFYVKNRVK
jgi:hypothetical protein